MKNNKLEKASNRSIKKISVMNKSSKKGIFLSVIVLFSLSLILTPVNGYAEEINVRSIGLDKTTIITFTNDGVKEVKIFKIWLSQDVNFQSFKTEKGWVGEKTPQGVIIFTSSESIKKDESIKFGIKTDKSSPIINWKGLDQTSSTIDTGVIATTKIEEVKENTIITPNDVIGTNGEIFSDSTFKVIPEKPNIGSTIRVTGNSFGALQTFDFYINADKIGNFETDEHGFFITTMKIPNDQKNERVDFIIKDKQDNEKIFSVRLGDEINRITEQESNKLTVEGIKKIVHQGDILDIYGKGIPNTSITVQIFNPERITTNTIITQVDSVGKWKLDEDINIPLNAIFGKYSIIVSDGKNQLLKYWEIQTDKKIIIEPVKRIFNAGELIKFQGTGIPNTAIEMTLENQLGDEMVSENFQLDDTGLINFEYQTTENDDLQGTWILIVIQGEEKESVYFGYDEIPSIPINVEFDKENYNINDKAMISLTGEPSDNLKIIIVNPTGGIQGKYIPIKLKENGKAEHVLDLTGFTSGVYSAVIQKGNSQNTEQFSVGLQIGSGPIEAKTTQSEYRAGERILILGNANANSLMTLTLIDPIGNEVKKIRTPTNNDGIFSEDRIKIPMNAILGAWKMQVSSGQNLMAIEFIVSSISEKPLTVSVTEEIIPGEMIEISVSTDKKESIRMEIMNGNNEIIENSLNCTVTKDLKCQAFWIVPKDAIPGTYTIKAMDSTNEDTVTFLVKFN